MRTNGRANYRDSSAGRARVAHGALGHVWWFAAIAVVVALSLATTSHAAAVAREEAVPGAGDGPVDPKPVPESEMSERIVVDPAPTWDSWGESDETYHHYHPGGLRIDTWVDRGEWATYEPGERLAVFFRVNRPCYVTILDYTTDGRVETLYPNPWSGSAIVSPGRVYRIPDDRRYSLRIAGPGGVETLVACAHELPWPSGSAGSSGWWSPQYHPWFAPRGRVVSGGQPKAYVAPGGKPSGYVVPGSQSRGRVVKGSSSERSGSGRYPSGWGPPQGRVVVGPGWWPVPDRWHESPGRWACDSVTFRVDDGHDSGWGSDWWHGDEDWDEYDYGYDGGGGWAGHAYGRPLLHERFRMSSPRDEMDETFRFDGEKVHVKIDCVASRKGDPTEIVGRVGLYGGWGDETVFRIDASGRDGVVPRRGDVYSAFAGPIRVDVEVIDVRMVRVRPWQLPRIEWITFDVKAYGG